MDKMGYIGYRQIAKYFLVFFLSLSGCIKKYSNNADTLLKRRFGHINYCLSDSEWDCIRELLKGNSVSSDLHKKLRALEAQIVGIDDQEFISCFLLIKSLLNPIFYNEHKAKLSKLIKILVEKIPGSGNHVNQLTPEVSIAVAVLGHIPQEDIKEYIINDFNDNITTTTEIIDSYQKYLKAKKVSQYLLLGRMPVSTRVNIADRFIQGNDVWHYRLKWAPAKILDACKRLIDYNKVKSSTHEQIFESIKHDNNLLECFLFCTEKLDSKYKEPFMDILAKNYAEEILNYIIDAREVSEKYTLRWIKTLGTEKNKTQAIILATIMRLNGKKWMQKEINEEFSSLR